MRFFLEQELQNNSIVKIEKEEFHHLKNVLRIRKNEIIEIINGENILCKATVLNIDTTYALTKIFNITKQKEQQKKIVLIQPFIKQKNLELIIEKGTELGVDNFIFFPSKYSSKNQIATDRLKKIMISSIKQCTRLDLPKISILKNIKDLSNINISYFGDIRKKAPSLITLFKKEDNYSFLIGPEKGFSKEELLFLENTLKIQGIRINKNILRAETAAISLASFFSSFRIN